MLNFKQSSFIFGTFSCTGTTLIQRSSH